MGWRCPELPRAQQQRFVLSKIPSGTEAFVAVSHRGRISSEPWCFPRGSLQTRLKPLQTFPEEAEVLPAVRTHRAARNPSEEEMETQGIPAAAALRMQCGRERAMERENHS